MSFYVYIYFDPRICCEYIIDNIKYNYKPVYVGKGTGNRYKAHLNKRKKNYRLHNLIHHLKCLGVDPVYHIIKEFDNEHDAHLYEKHLIESIGRADRDSGPLFNLTDGGEGTCGIRYSEQDIAKRRKNMLLFWSNLSEAERRVIGQKSLSNRDKERVLKGAVQGTLTRQSKSATEKQEIESRRYAAWCKNYCNTDEKIKQRSIKCSLASRNRSCYYLTILYIDTGIVEKSFLKDLIAAGCGKDALEWRIKGKTELSKPYKTSKGPISILKVERVRSVDIMV